jgi:transmembrane sensor
VRFPALAATAALAASLVLAAVWWLAGTKHSSESAHHVYATTIDGYQRVSLEDGSIVELNSSSEISVYFSPVERRVRLARGEAHFTVAKIFARPFLVEAGAIAVRAVGTAFNVRLGADDIEVLVTEGRIAVASGHQAEVGGRRSEVGGQPLPKADPRGRGLGMVYTELGANERIVIPAVRARDAGVTVEPPAVERLAPEVVREALGWQGPRLMFLDTPLADAIAQFNRRNPVQLELADAGLGTLPIGGSFRAENVEAFVRLLSSGGEIEVERPGATRIILRKAK